MVTSTNYNPAYARSRLMERVTLDDGVHLDTMNQKYIDIVRSLPNYHMIAYSGDKITTLSQRYYQTTTLWWLILMYNGYYSPLEIQTGTMLRIPNKNDVDQYLAARPQNYGTSITF